MKLKFYYLIIWYKILRFIGILSPKSYKKHKNKINDDIDKLYQKSNIKKYIEYKKRRIAKNTVYTCITGEYDDLQYQRYINFDWDYICFTDNEKLINAGNIDIWEIRALKYTKSDNIRNARWHKTHPHELLQNYEYSLWVDGNVNIISGYIFNRIKNIIKKNKILSIPEHFERNCIYDEISACEKSSKDNPKIMSKMQQILKSDKFPKNYGLHETTLIFRKHMDKKCIKIMNEWWHFIENYSRRDQLSLDYVLWENKLNIPNLTNPSFRFRKNDFKLTYNSKQGKHH